LSIIVNNTITGNSAEKGGGFCCKGYSHPKIANTILWGNTAQTGSEIWIGYFTYSATLTISHSDVEGGQPSCYVGLGCNLNWGSGMIDAEPIFVDPGNDDFHLSFDSPCRNSGYNLALLPPTDFEGDPRIALGTVDMGADEYYYHLYHTGTVSPGSPIDVKVVGYPGAAVTLFLGVGIQDPPYFTQHGDFWLTWPPVWQADLGTVPGDGVLVYPATVPSGWVTSEQHPLQSLVGPWGGPWSHLTNLMVLTVQ
jgi:hypothetical protein